MLNYTYQTPYNASSARSLDTIKIGAHGPQCVEDAGKVVNIMTAKMTSNAQTAKETMVPVIETVKPGKEKKKSPN